MVVETSLDKRLHANMVDQCQASDIESCQEWMAVQTLLSFSQSAVCRPHSASMTSSSQAKTKTKASSNEILDWNQNVQPLTPPPSDVGSMSPMSDTACDDSSEAACHDDSDTCRSPEKSILKELLVRDFPCTPAYLDRGVRSPSPQQPKSPSNVNCAASRSSTESRNQEINRHNFYATKKILPPHRSQLQSFSKTPEAETTAESVSFNVTHRSASLFSQNSTPLTSQPKSSSVTSPSQGYTSKLQGGRTETECFKLSRKHTLTQSDNIDRDGTSAELQSSKRRRKDSSVRNNGCENVQSGEQLNVKQRPQSEKINSTSPTHCVNALNDPKVMNKSGSVETHTDRVSDSGDGKQRNNISNNIHPTSTPETVSQSRFDTTDTTPVFGDAEKDCAEERATCWQGSGSRAFTETKDTAKGFCTISSNDSALIFNAGPESPGIQFSPNSTSMMLAGINGMLLSLPAAPTIQVIVVNNYPVPSTGTVASSPPISRPDGSRLCPIAPAPVAMTANGGTQQEKDPKSRSALSNRHRMYKCDHPNCNKTYFKNSHLKVHQRIHTGEKPFSCTWEGCGKKFARSDELSRHHRTHTGEKKYECVVCHQHFMRSDHLTKHMRRHVGASTKKAPSGATNVIPIAPTQLH